MSERRFAGKVVMITGASGGLGRACAEAFAAHGAEVVLVARRRGELEAIARDIRQGGASARVAPCDITDFGAVQRLCGELGSCDVLVNNAGANQPQPFLDVDPATLDRLLALNVRSMFHMAQACARMMVRQGAGVILNMSSQMGHVGAPNRTVYCMTKHAIEGLTKAMAVELAPLGVRVISIAPTYISTPMTAPFFEDPAFSAEALRRIPLGRIGSVEEVAAAAVFLASPDASLITGTSLLIDGGYTAQ